MSIFGKLKQQQNNEKVRNSSLPQSTRPKQAAQQVPQQIGTLQSNYANTPPNAGIGGRIPVRQASSQSQSSSQPASQPQSRIPSRSYTPKSHNPDRYPWITVSLKTITQAPSLIYPPPFPRYGHSANTVANQRGHIYIFGGLVADSAMNDLWLLETDGAHYPNANPIRAHWVHTNGDLPPPRVGHRSALWKNWILVWGGDTLNSDVMGSAGQSQDNILYAFDTNTRLWMRVQITGGSPVGRYGHSMGLIGDKLYIHGGQVNGDFFSDIAVFDLNQREIILPFQIKILTIKFRFGGTDGQYHYNDVWMFDYTNKHWSELSCIGYHPVPREGHSATIVKDVMYIFGGRGTDGKDLGDLAGFNILKRRWFAFQSMGPSPSGRSGQTMSTSGESVFVFGGEAFNAPDPANNTNDDPNIVHVLRHPRINYPKSEDNAGGVSRTPTPRLSESPQINHQSIPLQQQNQRYAHKANSSVQSQHSQDSQYATVPSTYNNNNNINSNGLDKITSPISPAGVTKTTNQSIPAIATKNIPQRPKRADDGDYVVSNMSPVVESPRSPIRPGNLREIRNQVSLDKMNQSPQITQVNKPDGFSPSQVGEKPPLDAFYYSNQPRNSTDAKLDNENRAPTTVDSDEVKELKKRDQWMRIALEMATKNGFVLPPGDDVKLDNLGEIDGDKHASEKKKIIDSLMKMKQELSKAHSTISLQSEQINGRKEESERAYNVILHEASFLKAKLHAYENNDKDEVLRLEKDKMHSVESKLIEALSKHGDLEKKYADLEKQLESSKAVHEIHTQDLTNTIMRADTAESSHLSVLEELHEAQRKLHVAETALRDHQVANSASTAKASQVDEAQKSRDEHRSTLAMLREALNSTESRSREIEKRYEDLITDLSSKDRVVRDLELQLSDLTNNLDNKTREHEEAHNHLKTLGEEAEKYKLLANEGLSRFLGSSSETRDVDADSSSEKRQSTMFIPHDKYLAMEQESSVLRSLLEAAGAKVDETHGSLAVQNKRFLELQTQLKEAVCQVTGLRAQLNAKVHEHDESRNLSKNLQEELEIKERSLDEVRIELDVLKSYIEEDDGKRDSVANENLERQLSLNHELEQKHQMTLETKSELEAKIEEMTALVHDLKLAKERSVSEDDHAEAKARIETLEKDYKQAVDYVKGTEKFVYRLKQELIKARESNQQLEREMKRGSTDSLRRDYATLKEELERQRKESNDKVKDLEAVIKDREGMIEAHQREIKRVSMATKNQNASKLLKENKELIEKNESLSQRVQTLLDTIPDNFEDDDLLKSYN
ncbi:hypothetical protein E3Q06_01550 [Wallemia mellicola]|nr:hypothetical protein E3Q21_01721 [Wallemia mellicola]TIB89379.1 hypothetical protein E3Q20_01711 [Wallemia mellicola]TIC41300.1 hypothetical protein E3Q07_01630 [Wallemia mellicola]TIC49966.1 hypothetical protein E3Q06_01550 [Wallemia mellicola]